MPKIKVLIVDDHTLVRDGLRTLLALFEDIEIVGEAANGKEALEKVKQFMPDVVLMDIAMPIMDGLEATRRIRKEFPGTKVLILTQYGDKEYIFPVIEAGARGFITKVAGTSELVSGIRAVYKGDSFLCPSAARAFIEDYQQRVPELEKQDPYERLTDREREVLKLVAEGYTSQEIADMLIISLKTVEGHRSSLMTKLDLHNRTDLVKYALRRRIITL